ncbi:MAG: ACT domain-containing protein, partial [Gammaproteobacteria bacterium]|nr:ACT domain-containing protein [Gammaproteobacteria bacterium]
DRAQPVQWAEDVTGEFPVNIRLQVGNERGVLATLAAKIADQESNIENVDIEERDSQTTTITFSLTVRDRAHLALIMRELRKVPQVVRISRIRG